MEPINPKERDRILRETMAAPGDIEEYERLLAERFMSDPDLPLTPGEEEAAGGTTRAAGLGRATAAAVRGVRVRRALEQNQREERIAALYQRLFASGPAAGAETGRPGAKTKAKKKRAAAKAAQRAGAKKTSAGAKKASKKASKKAAKKASKRAGSKGRKR